MVSSNFKNCLLMVFALFTLFATVNADNCECTERRNGGSYYSECTCSLATGWIVAISIVSLLIVFGIPILCCFCCGLCCFAGRGNRDQGTVYVNTVQPGQQTVYANSAQPTPTGPYPPPQYFAPQPQLTQKV